MLTTPDEAWADAARRLREHGMSVSAADRHASGEAGHRAVPRDRLQLPHDRHPGRGRPRAARPARRHRRRAAASWRRRYQDARWPRFPGVTHGRRPAYGTTNFQSFWVVLPDGVPGQPQRAAGRSSPPASRPGGGSWPRTSSRRTPGYRARAAAGDRAAHQPTRSSCPLFHEHDGDEQDRVVEASSAWRMGAASMTRRCPARLVLVGAGGFARETAEVVARHQHGTASRRGTSSGSSTTTTALQGDVASTACPCSGAIDGAVRRDAWPSSSASAARRTTRPDAQDRRAPRAAGRAGTPRSSTRPPSCRTSLTARRGPVRAAGRRASPPTDVADRRPRRPSCPAVVFTHDDRHRRLRHLRRRRPPRRRGRTSATGAYVGAGALIREDLTIGAWSLVGMGSVVTRRRPARRGVGREPCPRRSVRDAAPSVGRASTAAATGRGGVPSASSIPLVDLGAQHAGGRRRGRGRLRGRSSPTAPSSSGPDVGAFEREFADFCRRRALRRRGQRHRRPRARPARPSASGAATRSSCRPTPSSPPPRRSCAPAPTPCSSTATARHLLIDPAARRRRGHAAAPVRSCAVHLYGQIAPIDELASCSGRRAIGVIEDAAQSQGATRHGRSSGQRRRRRRHQLLPGQEPRRLRRRRRGGHRRRRRRPTSSGRMRNHGGEPQLRARPRRVELPARHAAGRRPAGQARAASPAGTTQRRAAAAPLRRAARPRSTASVAAGGHCAGNEHVWHLYVVRVAGPRRGAGTRLQRGAASAPASTTRSRSTSSRRSATSVTAAGDFPVAERRPARCSRCRCSRASPSAQQERVVESCARRVE